jgi:2-aminoadipate transaminase
MVENIKKYFPQEVQYTKPEGGMFLWATLPKNISATELLKAALSNNVAFVPGEAFYTDGTGSNTMRLNFSNSSIGQIEKGIIILSNVLDEFIRPAKDHGLARG